MHSSTIINKIILCLILFLTIHIIHVYPVYSYSLEDVDNFIDQVKANPSQYGVDFSNGDIVYKEQYTAPRYFAWVMV